MESRMSPVASTWPREKPERDRLLVVDPTSGVIADRRFGDLPSFVKAGDVIVLNDAATLPASFSGDGFEARFRAFDPENGRAEALLFGAGSWREPTEERGEPPQFVEGDRVRIGELGATIAKILGPRLVELELDARGAELWQGLYAAGKPIQYSYLAGSLELWHVQSRFAGRPWAFEMPSAGRPLTWNLIFELEKRGARVVSLTHAAGLSSTGSSELDRELPLPERYEIPEETVRAIAKAERVIAIGTSVTRALEASAAEHGALTSGTAVAHLRIGPSHRLRVVSGISSGIHEPGTSHFELLQAFASGSILAHASRHAITSGYLGHEFGDSCLILPGALASERDHGAERRAAA
jgi:S-adenosylmethionine:tRNA ribosyltransferase-isomerase